MTNKEAQQYYEREINSLRKQLENATDERNIGELNEKLLEAIRGEARAWAAVQYQRKSNDELVDLVWNLPDDASLFADTEEDVEDYIAGELDDAEEAQRQETEDLISQIRAEERKLHELQRQYRGGSNYADRSKQ
jgi:hypothetical protein